MLLLSAFTFPLKPRISDHEASRITIGIAGYHYNPMAVYDTQTLRTSAETAAVAELAYVGPDGSPRIEALTPLLSEKEPVFALPYSRMDLARCLENNPHVSLTFSDSRLARVGWSPLTVEGKMKVTPDPEGDLFLEEPLYWELRKFWPSRQLIGSLVLRRDNWWYVPRLILRFTETETPRPITRRTEPDQGILAWKDDGSVFSDTVRVDDWDTDRPLVSSLSQKELPDNAPATLLHHDFSIPDREQRASLSLAGTLKNNRLSVTRREGTRTLEKRPGLIARWRAQKDLERLCKAGLKGRETS